MPMDTEGRNTGAVVKADILLSGRDTLRVGGEYQRYRFDDWWDPSGNGGMSPNTFWDINNGQRDRYAIFGEWEARWNPQWLSLFGVRSETVKMDTGTVQGYNTGATYLADATRFNASDRSRTDNNWDMTALARYTADSSKTYEFGYARKTRSPNLYERYTWSTGGMAMNMINMTGDGNGYVGNLDLKPEVANTISATADWHDADQQNWGLKVTPYYSLVEDYINARRCTAADGNGGACTMAAQTSTDKFVFLKYINQDAKLYGLNVSGYFPLAKNTGYGSFTATGLLNYVRGKTTSGTDDNLYNMMPLNAKLAVIHQLGSWTNTAEVVLVDAKDDVSQQRNEVKTAGYGLLNLRSSYTWKQARFDVGIDNVFDRLYDYPLGGAYVGQGTTMPPKTGPAGGYPSWGVTVPGMGRSIYAGVNVKF
jgi:iron complex outermembrane receptor protein